jgi:hypothetical protein
MKQLRDNISIYFNVFRGTLQTVTTHTESFVIIVLLAAICYIYNENSNKNAVINELTQINLDDYRIHKEIEMKLQKENSLLHKSNDSLIIELKYLNR